MGDHTETAQLDYDPSIITYQELVQQFFSNHNPNRKPYRDREYISIILFYNEEQREIAEEEKKKQEKMAAMPIQTEISPYKGFTLAEDRQQKWHIKRNKTAMEELKRLYPSEEALLNSTLVARMNGLAKGYGSVRDVENEISRWNIDKVDQNRLLKILNILE